MQMLHMYYCIYILWAIYVPEIKLYYYYYICTYIYIYNVYIYNQNIERNRNNCSATHSQSNKATSEMDNTGVNQHCVKRVYLQTNQAAWLQREQYHSDSNK